MTVTVIGAGVMGLAVATELTARGITVSMVENAPVPGPAACSWWAGGMLAPWCERESAEEPVLRLGREAAGWWQRHTGIVRQEGTLVLGLARDEAELSRFARRTSGYRQLDAESIAALEPDLGGRFRRGLFFAEEAHLTPRAALASLLGGLRERGVEFTGKAAGRIIDCRGLAARDVLHDLRGVRGEMLMVRCPDITLSRPVRLLHPRIPLYIVPRGDGVYMLGATMIESNRRGGVTVRSALEMLSAAFALHPAFGEAEVLEMGADARPAFPDNLPHLREIGDTLYANGLYRHGFLLAPAVARMTADYIETGLRPEIMDETHHS